MPPATLIASAIGFDPSLPTARGYQSANKLNFHTANLVGLMCLRKAKSGGLSSIVSSGTVFNEMLKVRPDLVKVLSETLYRDRRGEIPEGREPWYRLPVFNFRDGRLTTNYVRSTMEKAQRFNDVPRLTDAQREAFLLIESIATTRYFISTWISSPATLIAERVVMHSWTARLSRAGGNTYRLWLATEAGRRLPIRTTNSWIKPIREDRTAISGPV